jgi:hypothetical protein
MREFLREYEIENSDIADICFVQGDQWYIQGHETCIGAYPEVRFSFLGGCSLAQKGSPPSPLIKKHFSIGYF